MKSYVFEGVTYASGRDLCAATNLRYGLHLRWECVYLRLKRGWSLKRALLTAPRYDFRKYLPPVDHLGRRYKSFKDMFIAWGIDVRTASHRLHYGWSIEETLTTPVEKSMRRNKRPVTDHLGNHYETLGEMLKKYDMTYQSYYARKKLGLTIKQILTVPKYMLVNPKSRERLIRQTKAAA